MGALLEQVEDLSIYDRLMQVNYMVYHAHYLAPILTLTRPSNVCIFPTQLCHTSRPLMEGLR